MPNGEAIGEANFSQRNRKGRRMNPHPKFPDIVVLLVEDDRLQAEAYLGILADLGIVVLVANRYHQGMRLMRRYASMIDFVVCDNRLGDLKVGSRFREVADRLGIGCTVV